MSEIVDTSPERIGPYEIGSILAAREYSTVYRAIDTRDDRVIAVKVVRPPAVPGTRLEVDFGRELRLAAAVQHPHLLRILDSGWDDDHGWVVYELARGGSLQDRIGEAGRMSVSDVRRLALEVGDALRAIHEAGMLHRDVKPSNILIEGDEYLLGDFGASRLRNAETTGTIVGSITYMAPEQAHGETGEASDVYCLGATLFRAWTGKPPPPLAQRLPEWSAEATVDPVLRGLITSMLHPNPSRRPQLAELPRILGRRRRVRRALGAVAVAGLALGVLGIAVCWPGDTEEEPGAARGTVATSSATATDAPTTAAMSVAATAASAAPGLPFAGGALVMTEQDPHSDWGANPVYYLYRGIRFHVGSPDVLMAQVDLFRPRPEGQHLGWVGWPECCEPYTAIEHLHEGPELVFTDSRSDWLLIRRDGEDEVWGMLDGIRVFATEEFIAQSPGPQQPEDAITLAGAIFDALPTEHSADPVATATPACLVAGGAIAELYEQHREGLGDVVQCETTLPDRGAYARWANGTVSWAPGIGAYLTVFSIDAAYWSEGGPEGWLGYTTAEESDEPSGQWTRMSAFEHGVIVWTPEVGTKVLTRQEYLDAGGTPEP